MGALYNLQLSDNVVRAEGVRGGGADEGSGSSHQLMIIRAEGHAREVRAVGAVNRPEGRARGTGAVGAVITAGGHTPWERAVDSADVRVWCARAVGAVSAQARWCSCRCVGMVRILWVLQWA